MLSPCVLVNGVSTAVPAGLVHGRTSLHPTGAHHYACAGRPHLTESPSSRLHLQGGYRPRELSLGKRLRFKKKKKSIFAVLLCRDAQFCDYISIWLYNNNNKYKNY